MSTKAIYSSKGDLDTSPCLLVISLTDGSGIETAGGAWTGDFKMDATHAEPKGYFACTQTPDGVIHLISSRLHYRFNLSWIQQ